MEVNQPNLSAYHILVKETLEQDFIDGYGDLTIISQKNGATSLVGKFSDQSALRGFLEQLWNLNITVITVERIENES
ncbi:MAG: hypothetical protein C3F13_00235 [Anaerolineales bacterium]|nr:MAG: hypothetical protein C3F13_00235 [Anaerolineales bacterium]